MNARISGFWLNAILVALIGGTGVGVGCESTPRAAAPRKAPARASTVAVAPHASNDANHAMPVGGVKGFPGMQDVVEGKGASIAMMLESLGDEGKAFHAHVTTLSNPFFEGRVPGSRGNDLAAEYVEHYFKFFGLTPAFAETVKTENGSEVEKANGTYRQPFTVPGDPEINKADVKYEVVAKGRTVELKVEQDYNPLAIGANGEVSGPPVFVGYAIEEGKDGYSSFSPHDDLTGKIAIAMRFEPMDEHGKSLWSEDEGWSSHAGLLGKVRAAASRGAKAVILVNAPGADDKRASRIMSIENSRIGGKADVPVIMMTAEAVDSLVKKADSEGRSLMELRRLADKGEITAVDMPGVTMSMAIDTDRKLLATQNVGGVLPGKGALADEWLIIGAHYDHIGYGNFGSRTPEHKGEVHPGADDNASGTSGLLLLARRLSDAYAAMKPGEQARSILFLAFSAEEMGLLGSKEFVAHPSVPFSQTIAMINMDMIGRLRKDGVEVSGVGTGEGLDTLVQPIVDASGIKAITRKSGQMPSDQASFLDASVPVVGFFTGTHPEYHTVYDVGSTINHAGAVAIARLIGDIALALATHTDKFAFHSVETKGPKMGSLRQAKVRFGIAPGNYADTEPGVLVGGVSEGTTAAKAGVQKGDRIIKWGGEELADVVAMMDRLASHNPGDHVQIVVLRDGKEVMLNLVMQARGDAQ